MGKLEDIQDFEKYVISRKVIKSNRDPSESKSLIEAAKRKFMNMEKLGITKETATDYFENVYECLKMLVQSFMALDGYKSYSHEATIAYGIEFLNISIEEGNKFNKFRKLRNDISYRGAVVTLEEAKNIKNLFKSLLTRLEAKLKF